MSAAPTKKNKPKKRLSVPEVKVDKNMKSYANDPFFVKKAQEAKAFIDKHGLPGTNVRR